MPCPYRGFLSSRAEEKDRKKEDTSQYKHEINTVNRSSLPTLSEEDMVRIHLVITKGKGNLAQ